MGYVTAQDVRSGLPEDQALAWHLQYNHYPPISLVFLPVIREALSAARRGGTAAAYNCQQESS